MPPLYFHLSVLALVAMPMLPAEDSAPRFRDRIFAHEPIYFAVDPGIGSEPVTAKFQFSMAIAIVTIPDHAPASGDRRPDGLYAAYSQTSFWDLQSESKPFLDSSYRPEVFLHKGMPGHWLGGNSLALEAGFQHESNGQEGPESRSLNSLCVRSRMSWELEDDLTLNFQPQIRSYVGDITENPELGRYRGHTDFVTRLGYDDGWAIRTMLRIGDDWDRGGIEIALSHPLDTWTNGWMGGFLYFQTFQGWSESLATYDEQVEQPRILIGWAVVR